MLFYDDANNKTVMARGSSTGELSVYKQNNYWKDQRFDYTSGDLDYKGLSQIHKAATDIGDLWWIWKYTWSGANLVRIEGPLNGVWDSRAALGWG